MVGLSDWNDRVLQSWMWFEMSMQVIGLIRYCRYPVAVKAFNILQGFSILEFLYVPNVFLNAFPVIYSEVTYPIMSFININHNFIVNIGS